jgi:replication factor C subunit 2/4
VRTSEGDLRKAITYLQTSAKLFAPPKNADGDVEMAGTNAPVTVRSIEEIAGVVPGELIEKVLEVCHPGKGGLYSRVGPVVQSIVAEGWSAGSIITQVFPYNIG